MPVKPLSTYTCKLTDAQSKALLAWLRAQDYEFREIPYAVYAAAKENVNVVLYESRKLVVQGKGTQEFVEFVLEPQILGEARLGYEAILNPDLLLPRIGVDESGKGDFFGPLCIAGVYVNAQAIKSWEGAGIRDSKKISSDKAIADFADLINRTPSCVTRVVPIGNEAYNRLFRRLHSVNTMLAWGHARAIENLMLQKHRMNPPPVRAISDQFAAKKEVVAGALMSLGREIELIQRHKAEADIAVAAASILARHEFLTRLAAMGKKWGLNFPKGASEQVESAGKEFVAKHGPERLPEVAKMHFRTANRVLVVAKPGSQDPPHDRGERAKE
jgi:ribonuclease HIII